MAVNNPKHQGIFHLVTILFIPAILVSFFLAENYWLGGILFAALISILVFIFNMKAK